MKMLQPKALESLEKATILAHPERYIELSSTLNNYGFLIINANNTSPYPLHNIVVTAHASGMTKQFSLKNQTLQLLRTLSMQTDIAPVVRGKELSITITSVRIL